MTTAYLYSGKAFRTPRGKRGAEVRFVFRGAWEAGEFYRCAEGADVARWGMADGWRSLGLFADWAAELEPFKNGDEGEDYGE